VADCAARNERDQHEWGIAVRVGGAGNADPFQRRRDLSI
jgi:hypothetical protein